jgi:SAM-dependent methyltransferase
MKEEIIPQLHGPDIIEGHLGGCSIGGDGGTYYPIMWKYLIDNYNVKTVLDIGCGRGYSAKYFESIGCDILGIDGSTKAQEMSLIPEHFLLNDYETGPALSRSEIKYNDKPLGDFIFDLCWCCEFVEHVEEQFIDNFLSTFAFAKYVAMTHAIPGQGGHHHVNCQPKEYWIENMARYGFEYDEEFTNELKEIAKTEGDYSPHFVATGLFFKKIS